MARDFSSSQDDSRRSSRDGQRGGRGGKKPKRSSGGFRKRRPPASLRFDYKNVQDLIPFITEEGKIMPGRVSGLNANQQRQLTTAIKRARNIGFLSAVGRTSIH
ncbi:MAG: 30S ribosomal protein S18 [Bradymonadales bacterium]|nr:MAG: 30S ribosomal protein S18 [Bradymonadales bacterium]